LNAYTQLLKLDPKHLNGLINASIILKEQSRFPESIALLKRAVSAKPSYWNSHFTLAETYLASGNAVLASQEIKLASKYRANYEPIQKLAVQIEKAGI